jgi:ketosteroid isomerase-like protein
MRTTSILLIILGHASTVVAQASSDTTALRREIEQLNRGMEAAVNRGDLLAAAAFYADDAVVRTLNGVVAQGRTAIDGYFRSIGKAQWKLDVIAVGGAADSPYQVGRSTLIHGSRPDTSIVGFLVIWKRQRTGQLRIALDYYHGLPRN